MWTSHLSHFSILFPQFEFRIDMLNTKEFPDKAGRIFPPLINIEYGEVTPEDVKNANEMDFEFKVTYKMEMREARKDIEVLFLISQI